MPQPQPMNDLEQQLRDLRVIQAFASTLLHHSDSIDDILWDLAQQAVARIGLEDCVIYLLDEASGDLIQRAAFGPKNHGDREVRDILRLRLGEGIVGCCAAVGEPVLVADTREDPRYITDDAPRLSELAIPIFRDGAVIGVIDSENSQPGFFTSWHVDMLTTLAAMTASRITAAQLEAKRIELATRDYLTGLMNRSEFFGALEARIQRGERTGCLLHFNIDHFSSVNQWVGSSGGDELLQTVAERLLGACPSGTPVARLGSDEFGVILTMPATAARTMGRGLLDVISRPIRGGVLDGLKIAASAGLASLDCAATGPEISNFAALAMREAKESGRGRLRSHDARIAERKRREQRIAIDLSRDLQTNASGLAAYFQPIISLRDNRIAGAEVLARWRHRELGDVSPTEFVRAAEASGSIHDLGQAITRKALENIRAWGAPAGGLTFNINVSPLQIQRDGFLGRLIRLLDASGLNAERIACEVTESTLLADQQQSSRVLGALAERGVRLVLDDFGTGYASLATLTRFAFSGVKIDRSFVKNIIWDRRSSAVVRSVIAMSEDLGLTCTAEGIETIAQLDHLRNLGCGLGQGWVFAPALAPAAFLGRLSAGAQSAA